MNPQQALAALQLIADLYAQLAAATAEIERLRSQVGTDTEEPPQQE